MTYVLDTHTIVWYLATDPRLSPAAEAVLDNLMAQLVLPTIVLTALVYRDLLQLPTTLITKDTKITQSGLIQTLW